MHILLFFCQAEAKYYCADSWCLALLLSNHLSSLVHLVGCCHSCFQANRFVHVVSVCQQSITITLA